MFKRFFKTIIFLLSCLLLCFTWVAAFYFTFAIMLCEGLIQFVNGWVFLSVNDIITGFCKVICCWIPGALTAFFGTAASILLSDWRDDL